QLRSSSAVYIEPLPLTAGRSVQIPESNLERVAVNIFTSGSTAYGKIVQQTEGGILSNVDALIAHHSLDETSAIPTPLPLFLVNAVESALLGSFAVGGKIILLPKADADLIFGVVADEGVNILSIIPPVLSMLLLKAQGRKLNALRYILSAAAPLSTDL